MRQFAGDPPIEDTVSHLLRDRGDTVAVAESVTGGLTASLLTDIPGASEYLDRAWVVYAYDAWRTTLGVSRETLDDHGAVSGPAAGELAARARDLADTTWGLSTTGVAGPGGGSPETPVGTAFVGVSFGAPWESGDSFVRTERHEFAGNRTEVRERIARAGLQLLVRELENRS